ncbi:MAG: hypothetical protein E6779_06965, partial [Finegoldia magna]|nr:hypothetical protein [Finegoldia magna]
MSEFGSEVSSSEVSGDSGTTSDVSEVDTGSEVSESEMDEDLYHELDDSYDSYMEEGEGKSFESDLDENEEVEETELQETDEPPDDFESDLDSKYDSYIEDKDLSLYEKSKDIDELDSEVDDYYNEYVEHGERSESIDNVDNKTDAVESNSDLKPMSRKACEKCHDAGLTDEQVEEIREIPNGEKPELESYLNREYIDDHLAKFEESGCYKIVSNRRGEPSGTIGDESVFVINGEEVNQMIDKANGDPKKIEEALGMPEG